MALKKNNQKKGTDSGRLKKFADAAEMQKAIDDYFNRCDRRVSQVYVKIQKEIVDIEDPVPYTIEGLCNALGMTRDELLNYEKEEGNETLCEMVKQAKLKVQQNLVERSLEGKNSSAIAVFIMKNNFGYGDKEEAGNTKDLAPVFSETKVKVIRSKEDLSE